ncbi:MAG TPA: gliding motility-associated C-terminal domain-containing protein [Saprospiraceae bacterium]|nr:gliding motility-associated C-terminal domain-containing protein [Saprospiraceae bacterium]
MRQWIILCHIICLPIWGAAQVCGLEDTLWINPDATHVFNIEIAGLVNDNLADPAQGICGVEIEFAHQFVENLELWLVSPAGDTVRLIGPNSNDDLAFTFFARWDIRFVPCAATAMPDFGYAAQWSNEQVLNYVSGGLYLGSYYPFSGCLEDFDTGPVNGTWQIIARNDPSPFYGGAIVDFRLIFCDERGIDCCFSDAGVFINPPNMTACQGADTLSFRLPPLYFGQRPDSTLYGYRYVVALNDTLVAYDSIPDLRAYPPGNYTVCGLSFERAFAGDIPPPDGQLTLDSLRRNLNGFTPDFCGELTPVCAEIVIVPPPDTTFLADTICFGDTVYIHQTPYATTGIHTQNLPGYGGCDSIVQLQLLVRPQVFTALDSIICLGDSVVVGSSVYNQSGMYFNLFTAATGCDSIVGLQLTVLQPVFTNINTAICAGDTIRIGNESFWQSGTYTVSLSSASGCDSIVTLQLDVFSASIAIAVPDTITCSQPEVTLDAGGSIGTQALRYLWRNMAGDSVASGVTWNTSQSGQYVLEISPLSGNPQCSIRDTIEVFQNRIFPDVSAGVDDTLTCRQPSLQLGLSGSVVSPHVVYQWTTDVGLIVSSANQLAIEINGAGQYFLVATDTLNGCTTLDTAVIQIDTLAPVAVAGPDTAITCTNPTIVLDGSASGAGLEYLWSGPCLLGNAGLPNVSVHCAGMYILQTTSPGNGCTAFDTVVVVWDTLAPVPDAGLNDTLTCLATEITLQGSVGMVGNNLTAAWSGPGIVLGGTTEMPLVNLPGEYILEVRNADNGCTAADTVSIAIDTIAPVSDAGALQRIDCQTEEVVLGGTATTTGPHIEYLWTTSGGAFSGPDNTAMTTTRTSGVYLLEVHNLQNGCSDTSNVVVETDTLAPIADAGDVFVLDCQIREAVLNGAASSVGAGIEYEWTGPCIVGPANAPTTIADCPGLYTLTVNNTLNGCSASDTVSILLALATAIAVVPDTLYISCETGTVVLDGSSSVYGVFEWQFNGAPSSLSEISPVVSMPGEYVLLVNTLALNCPDADTTIVLLDCQISAAIAALTDTLTCAQTTATLNGSASSAGPAITYSWTGPAAGCIASGQGTSMVQVVCPGEYTLTVSNTAVGISEMATVMVQADTIRPLAEAGPADTITCIRPFALLNGSASSTGAGIMYEWTDAGGAFVSALPSDTATVPGLYFLSVTNTVNGCQAVDFVTISRTAEPPVVNFGNTVFPCNRDSFLLRAFPELAGFSYQITWSGPGLLSDNHAADVWIDTAGLYIIEVLNMATGCSIRDSVWVTQPECGPCIAVSPPDTVTCQVTSVVLNAAFCEPCPGCTVQWSVIAGAILSGAGTLMPEVRAGTYTLSATDTAGVITTLTVEVPADTLPPAADAGPDRIITCEDAVVMLGAGPVPSPEYRYRWLQSNVSPGQNQLLVTVQTPGFYVLEVENMANGCVASDTVLVTIDTLRPVAEAGPDQVITCGMPFAIPDAAGSTLGNNIAYAWSTTSPGIIAAGENTLNPIITAAGWYRLLVTNTLNGCTAEDSLQVTLSAQLPFVPDVPDMTLTCSDTVLLLNPILPDTAGLSFQWCRMVGTMPTDCSVGRTVSINMPGTWRFEVLNTSTGCRNADFVVVSQDLDPPVAEAGASPLPLNCTRLSVPLAGMAGPAGVPVEIAWSTSGSGTAMPDNVLNPTVTSPGIYTLTVTRTDNGCSASDSVEVLLNDNFPVANAGPDTSLTCRVTELRLQGSAQTIGAPAQWNWSSPDATILEGAQTPNPRINQAGLYILTITDPANGCTDTDTVVVIANQLPPDIDIQAPEGWTLNCLHPTLVLDASGTTSSGPVRFQWFGTPGSIDGRVDSSAIRANSVGFYRLVVEDVIRGCRDTAILQIGGDFAVPSVAVAAPLVITCARPEVTLTAIPSPPGDFYTTRWLGPSGDTVAGAGLTAAVRLAGAWRVWVTDTRNGCFGIGNIMVAEDLVPPVARIAAPDTLDCTTRSVLLNGSASVGRGALAFEWSGPSGGITTGNMAVSATAMLPGVYFLEVTDALNGCRDTAEVLVVETSVPITGVEAEIIPPACPGTGDGSIHLLNIEGGTGPYGITFNGSGPSLTRDFYYLSPGVYTVRIQDALGCSLDTSFNLLDPPLLTVDLGADLLIRLGDSVRLEAMANLPVTAYRWAPAEAFSDAGAAVQLVTPLFTTTYQVTVTNAEGCTATDWITLTVNTLNLYFAPDAFSPNGDGNNDYYTIFAAPAIKEIQSLHIFDRWGNMVFSRSNFPPNDPALGWDGNFEGRPMNAAVFVVMAEIVLPDGRLELYKGELTLLR